MPKLLYYQKNNSVYFVNDDGVNPLDYSIGTFPVNSIKTSIDPTDTELIIFSHNQPSNAFEIIKKRFNEIADETGTLYAGANAVDVLDSINLAVGQIATTSGGGGGGGDATAANQVLQTNELQDIKANTLPLAILFNRFHVIGLSGFTIPRPFRWAKIERPFVNGAVDSDSVTIEDINGVPTELYAGDTIELPLLSLQNIYNFNLNVQISNQDIELFISYNE